MGGAAAHLEPHDEGALGLDADLQVGRLAADRELAQVAGVGQAGGRLRVRSTRRRTPRRARSGASRARPRGAPGVGGQIGQCGQHRRERALHVVGAAAVQAAVLAPGRELGAGRRGRRRRASSGSACAGRRRRPPRSQAGRSPRSRRGRSPGPGASPAGTRPRPGSPPRWRCRTRSGSRPGQDRRHRSRPDCGRAVNKSGSGPYCGVHRSCGTDRDRRVMAPP